MDGQIIDKCNRLKVFKVMPVTLHDFHSRWIAVLLTQHDYLVAFVHKGGHTLHNISTGRIADICPVYKLHFTTKHVRSDRGKKLRFIPVKSGHPEEACDASYWLLICSEIEIKNNMRERMVACRSHAWWCSVAGLWQISASLRLRLW